MKKQLIKLSFVSKDEWESIKKSLYKGEDLKEGIVEIFELGHLQKPPEKEGDEWGLYDDYSIDIVINEDFDYSVLEKYLISKQSKYLHYISGSKLEVITKKEEKPNSSWIKDDIKKWLDKHGVSYTSSMTKNELLNLV